MGYFKNHPTIGYKFGNDEKAVVFQDMSRYVDFIDQIKGEIAFYGKYYIHENERPDTISQYLYDSVDYYWSFFLLNDHIRCSGWPLTSSKLLEKCMTENPNTVLTSYDEITTIGLVVGTEVTGLQSGATATVVEINGDLGQVIVDSESFIDGEAVSFVDSNENTVYFDVENVVEQYNAVHHYEDEDGNTVDIDPTTEAPSLYSPITVLDTYKEKNDEQRQMIVIKPEYMERIASQFQSLVKG